MAGYTRQSSADIVSGKVVKAGPINNEFNSLQAAFSNINGHAHDGSSGNGPKINASTSLTDRLPIVNGGTNGQTALEGFNNLKQPASDSYTGVVEKATVAEVRDATVDKYISADLIETSSAWVDVGFSSTMTPNFDLFVNARIITASNCTLANPINMQDGVVRRILVKGGSGAAHSISFGSKYVGPLPEDTVSNVVWCDMTFTYDAQSDKVLVDYVMREL